jgi:putative transposase
MPWKTVGIVAQREAFVQAVRAQKSTHSQLCREFGISRPTGYLWLRRHDECGRSGLADQPSGARTPQRGARRRRWEEAVVSLRQAHPSWGAAKLRACLQRRHPRARLPSERTVTRLLRARQLSARARQRSPQGPAVPRPARTVARRCHMVWTVDFKGHFRTGDGLSCCPLTVRDLFSRSLLLAEPLRTSDGLAVRMAMTRCFRRHGLPRVIRVDNGPPFAGQGALGLSQLSAWWWRLGIQVEFTRPGKPQDNGAHEQMHRVLQAETAQPPAATWAAQVRRLRAFCRYYNTQRPHAALGQRTPSQLYRINARSYAPARNLRYPVGWVTTQVGRNGKIFWARRQRSIGQAFAGEHIAFKPQPRLSLTSGTEVVEVYWGAQLIGTLHASDHTHMRTAHWQPSTPPSTPPLATNCKPPIARRVKT